MALMICRRDGSQDPQTAEDGKDTLHSRYPEDWRME
jgi:hypothetical protein